MRHIVEVVLIPDASDALNQVTISTGHSETDAMNRAIQLAALVERKRSEGYTLAFAKISKEGDVVDLDLVKIDDER